MPEIAALSRAEAADKYGVHVNVITAAIHSGALQAKKVGRQYRIHVEQLEAWFAGLPDA